MNQDIKLYRCIFIKENKNYFIGKDSFNSKIYYIKKIDETEYFKLGIDNSFYAVKEEGGFILKKVVLNVINFNEVVKMAK